MTILEKIQRELEEIYRAKPCPSVENFILSQSPEPGCEETVLVKEKRHEYQIGLYLARSVLKKLEENSPWHQLGTKNLEPFCTAIEGVSHFLFLLHRIEQNRPVSKLELELQAEVDKYLLCSLTLEKQNETEARSDLHRILFERFSLLPQLFPAEISRYELANRWAHQFCHKLKKWLHPLERPRLIQEVRRFRQQGLQEKIHLC